MLKLLVVGVATWRFVRTFLALPRDKLFLPGDDFVVLFEVFVPSSDFKD